ncbi:hypothetical protein KUV46_15800 [Thalassovita mediterranea]|nr:hypothetical protein KUV46_15800 [Thalassovita mediterranea]
MPLAGGDKIRAWEQVNLPTHSRVHLPLQLQSRRRIAVPFYLHADDLIFADGGDVYERPAILSKAELEQYVSLWLASAKPLRGERL